jgi:hypothetical protein
MKKITLLVAILMVSSVAFAATGWFNDFLTIKVDGVETANNYYIGTLPDPNPTSATALQGKAFGTLTSLSITGQMVAMIVPVAHFITRLLMQQIQSISLLQPKLFGITLP